MGITIFTIAYNGYGKFLKQWLMNVKKCNPTEIVIVLGKDHGIDPKTLSGATLIQSDSNTMGTLRNLAIKQIKTEWMLYFSADDYLMPNVIEEIEKKKEYDAVALRYIEVLNGVETEKESAVINVDNMFKWRETSIPAYIAIRHKILYEDTEIPNYPYLFKIACKYMKVGLTDNICARYDRREGSHGDIANKTFRYLEFTKQIEKYAQYYYENRVIKQGYKATIDFGEDRKSVV